jgi:hypothetical protein
MARMRLSLIWTSWRLNFSLLALNGRAHRLISSPLSRLSTTDLPKDGKASIGGELQSPLSFAGPTTFTEGQAFLKHVLRPGSLQDMEGLSIATEFGFLLPDSTAGSGLGAHFAGIISQRCDWGTVHFNAQIEDTRDQHANLFFSTILEGPLKWKVRPAMEIYYENELNRSQTFSGLFGLIWQIHDNVAFDLAFRHGVTEQYRMMPTNTFATNEIRAGVTFGVPFHLMHDGAKR